MIDYSPFWKTLEISEENWYTLTKKYHMSSSTLYRLKHNQDISMKTVVSYRITCNNGNQRTLINP